MVMLGILVVTEGDTEYLFYKKLIAAKCPRGFATTSHKKLGGIGNFFNKRRKIERHIKDLLLKSDEVIVLLCYDSDVFEPQGGRLQATNPPPNPDELVARLEKVGANKVFLLTARRTLEDWIILDHIGVLTHLNLPVKTNIKGSTGLAKMENLYKLKGKVYNKNALDVQSLVEKLDMEHIFKSLPKDARKTLNEIFMCE